MKKLRVILWAMALMGWSITIPVKAQSSLSKRATRQLERQEKKVARKKNALALRKFYLFLLQNKTFVFEAQRIYLPDGFHVNMNAQVNLLAVKGNHVIIQLQLRDEKGLERNITARGNLTRWFFNPLNNENRAMIVSGQVKPQGASKMIFTITVSNYGIADAQIDVGDAFYRLSGRVLSFDEARTKTSNMTIFQNEKTSQRVEVTE